MGLQRPKSLKLVIFGINFPKRGIPPESIFLQKLSWGGSPRFAPSRQISSLWEYSPQNRQNWYFFGINLPKKGVPLKRFLQNLVWQRESQVCTFMPNFTVVAVKMWAYSPQTGKKMVIFGINIAPKGKFWGSTEKLEYRCTTTNLPACNDTIIVLIIILLHGVSVITNFVIPKRNKQSNKQTKNITFFIYSRRRERHCLVTTTAQHQQQQCNTINNGQCSVSFTSRLLRCNQRLLYS